MTKNSESPNRFQAWSYVFVQAVLLALIIFLHQSLGFHVHRFVILGKSVESLGFIGILISAGSLKKSLTVVPLPKDDGKLSTTGLYRYVRHPMYASVLLFALGVALDSGSGIKYLLGVALFVLFYFKSLYEERYLILKYPEYEQYSTRIPRFVPFTK